jgi:hypothetical protein
MEFEKMLFQSKRRKKGIQDRVRSGFVVSGVEVSGPAVSV